MEVSCARPPFVDARRSSRRCERSAARRRTSPAPPGRDHPAGESRALGVCAPEDSARSNPQYVGVQLSNCYRIWYQDRRKPGQNRSAAQAPSTSAAPVVSPPHRRHCSYLRTPKLPSQSGAVGVGMTPITRPSPVRSVRRSNVLCYSPEIWGFSSRFRIAAAAAWGTISHPRRPSGLAPDRLRISTPGRSSQAASC